MLVNYRAFSWTYSAAELKKVLITQINDILSRSLTHAQRLIEQDVTDPDQPEMLQLFESLKAIRDDLLAGKDSTHDWTDLIDWSIKTFDNDPAIGGSYGVAKYYAKVKHPEEIPSGQTKILIDRDKIHLDLDYDVIV